ncbi:MAG: acetyl-CoA carboxylase, carboxyltransferase subunit beta [Hyphomicrobiaceae bacterium]
MNWINNLVRPKIRGFLTTKRDVPENLWATCPETGEMVFRKDLESNDFVFPGSEYHEQMTAPQRLAHLFGGEEAYTPVLLPETKADPLKFRDKRRYSDRLKEARGKTELEDAVLVGEGDLFGEPVVIAAQDFRFMAGSLGMAAGEAIIAGMLRAVAKKVPFILVSASGGARMQEGIMSLMQMPRTTIAVQRLREAGLPYIVVLTNPTTGGVTASYAMLGDIQIAEPGALICFAGPRVIQQTIREKLPEGFQRSEYLLEHGMIDMVVHRHDMRETLGRVCRLLMANNKAAKKDIDLFGKKNGKSVDLASVNGAPAKGSRKGSDADSNKIGSVDGSKKTSETVIEAEPVDGNKGFKSKKNGSARAADNGDGAASPQASGKKTKAKSQNGSASKGPGE